MLTTSSVAHFAALYNLTEKHRHWKWISTDWYICERL